MGLLISMISGALGGVIAGILFKRFDYGTLVNGLVGLAGGAAGFQAMKQASLSQGPESAQVAPFFELDAVVYFLLVSGGAGAILLVVYGALRNLASR